MLTHSGARSYQSGRCLRLVICIALLGMLLNIQVQPARAGEVGGIIDVDTTWTLAGSPYIVVDPVLVMEDVTLTIEPGVTVKFDSHTALQIQGELIAAGASNLPITFTSNLNPALPGDWDYIFFTNTSESAVYDIYGNYVSGSILQYVVIQHAGGSSLSSNNGALRLDGAAPFVDHCIIRLSARDGLNAWNLNHTLKLTHNTVSNNRGGGIYVLNPAGYTEVSDSLIEHNGLSEVSPWSGGGVNVGASWSGSQIVIVNNIVRGNAAMYNYAGINTNYSSNTTVSNNLVSGNMIYDCPLCWDRFSLLVHSLQATVSRNLIVDNDTGGLETSLDGEIVNNVISDNSGRGVILQGGTFTMTHNTILRNSAPNDAALTYYAGELPIGNLVSYNTILSNVNTAGSDLRTVYLYSGNPRFTNNNLYANNGYALYNNNAQGSPNINAENNWWGTIGTSAISALIYDWFDDSSRGIVDFSPYQTSHVLDAPISPPTGFSLTPAPTSITLDWGANPETDLAGYRVYYDTDAGYPYTGTGADQGDSPIDVGNATDLILTGLASGTRYYFTVTAYDSEHDNSNDQTDGNESWFSLEESGGIGQAPSASFSATPTSGLAPLDVAFNNQSSGDYDACLWDFGDGSTSFDCNNPSHTYTVVGVYSVSLTVVGAPGEDTLMRSDYIDVQGGVQAAFSGTPTSGLTPLQVDFTNESSGYYATCAWDFGDGGTSSDCDNPSHTYTSAGLYSVSLAIEGTGGQDSLTRTNYIEVIDGSVTAVFSAAPVRGAPPLVVNFTNLSTGNYTTCTWDFGDGDGSYECNNPTHTYTAVGVYTISLTVTGPGDSDTLTMPAAISITYAVFMPNTARAAP